MAHIDDLLRSKKVIVCAGSGGVGKTTVSASLAVRAAQIGLKVLVLTVDPARRLAAALGLKELEDEELPVPGQQYKGELYALMVNQKRILDDFVKRSGLNESVVERILSNKIYQKLSTTLSGSQEFTALEKLYASYERQKYDLIILDTPPAAHAIEFLDSAQKLSAFFQESIMKWFGKPFEKRGAIMNLIHRGTNLAFKALERLTGSEFVNELLQFLIEIYGLKDSLRDRMEKVHQLLIQDSTSFFLITAFDSTKIAETRTFHADLKVRHYRLSSVIVNRAFPHWPIKTGPTASERGQDELAQRLREFYMKLERYHRHHERAIDDLKQAVGEEVQFIRIPDFDQEVYDLKSLEKVASVLAEEK